ncbi:MAG: carbohydrate ABC transporter permease [Geodermatophilaceae bacterium]|nr:carbohydrate ABC transporter permease [Geodermatophilaceae bacterium]MDQ3456445.1 carbohydrate ABC transporter permease [Actinomycetota bacterium]
MTTSSPALGTTGTPEGQPAAERRAAPPAAEHGKASQLARGQANWAVKSFLLVLCLVWMVPLIGLLVTSFRDPDDANTTGWWTVFADPFGSWTTENYSTVVQGTMGPAFLNSFVLTIPATIIPILIAAFAAYAFTFMRFRGRDFLFILIVGLLVVPNQVALVPLLQIYADAGLVGTFFSVWLAHTGFGMPLAIFILRGYMQTLPRSIIESASVDGAGHFTTFWRLIVPMSIPALAAFAIFQFLWVWNDLLVAKLFLGSGENEPVTIALQSLLGTQGQGWQLITAGAFITMSVPLLVFITLQRFFVRGLTAGSVKG